MLVWPRDLIVASTVTWKPVVPGSDAVSNLGGQPQSLFLSGGQCWSLTMEGLIMRGREAVLAGRQMLAALNNGDPVEVRPCDCRQTPGATVAASFTADAALRATTVGITASGGRALIVGDQFSVTHAHWGLRLYRLIRDNGSGAWQIRPPLREAVTSGDSIDFNAPGCVMRSAGISVNRGLRPATSASTGRVDLVELERPVA